MQVLQVNGLAELCRLCGEVEKECFDLFDVEGQGEELLSKIKLAIRLSVSIQLFRSSFLFGSALKKIIVTVDRLLG